MVDLAHRRAAVLAGILAIGLTQAIAASASAHNWNYCGDGHTIRWTNPSTTFGYDLNWSAVTLAAIGAAATSINTTDFDYNRVGQSQAQMPWLDLGSSDPAIAGATYLSVQCSTHRIQLGTLYLNFSHFVTYGETGDQAKIQCVAIHEFGHGMGFDHNTDISILYPDHWWRCHTASIKVVEPHDRIDINARY